MLAGHGGTAVTWFGDTNTWATSSAFTSALLPDVAAYVSSHPVDRDRETVWTRVRDAANYEGDDLSPYERPRPAWSSAVSASARGRSRVAAS